MHLQACSRVMINIIHEPIDTFMKKESNYGALPADYLNRKFIVDVSTRHSS